MDAQSHAERSILEAEKFKATIADPGTSLNFCQIMHEQQNNMQSVVNPGSEIPNIGSGVSDDDFFHLTCHIDPNLIHKIEQGEFVELERLLPKDRFGKAEDRLEWVQREGGTYLVPAQRDNKIGSFRKWEQAFRAYATIYCGANLHHAKEIWQYITVIHTAAMSYLWDNVYHYNIVLSQIQKFGGAHGFQYFFE